MSAPRVHPLGPPWPNWIHLAALGRTGPHWAALGRTGPHWAALGFRSGPPPGDTPQLAELPMPAAGVVFLPRALGIAGADGAPLGFWGGAAFERCLRGVLAAQAFQGAL